MSNNSIYFPTDSAVPGLYKITSRARKHAHNRPEVVVGFQGIKNSDNITGVEDFEKLCQTSGQAAFGVFNALDKQEGVNGSIGLEQVHGTENAILPGQDASSAGLSFSLSLFHAWWHGDKHINQKKSPLSWPTVIATGEVTNNGNIFAVSGIPKKLQGILSWLELHPNTENVTIIYHPDNHNDASDLVEELESKGCLFIEARTVFEAIKQLYTGEDYSFNTSTNPFKGLLSYEYTDKGRFFGRDEDIKRVIKQLNPTKPLVLSGASGSGKSSLTKAGVIPELVKSSKILSWEIVEPDQVGQHFDAYINEENRQRLTNAKNSLLVIDQTEQLFRRDDKDWKEWIDDLLDLVNQSSSLMLLLNIRSDYKHLLEQHGTFASTNLYVGENLNAELTPSQWQAIIKGQCQYANLTLAPGVADWLMSEATKSPDNLPLMSLLLEIMYEASDGKMLTLDNHQTKKTEGECATDFLAEAIENQAEKAISSFSENELKQWLPVLFHELIFKQFGGNNHVISQHYVIDENTPEPLRRLIYALEEARLLKRLDNKNNHVALAHETIITAWSRVGIWLKEDRAFSAWLQKTQRAAEDWHLERGPLLNKGIQIEEARRWQQERPFELGLYSNKNVNDYIVESNKKLKQDRQKFVLSLASIFILISAFSVFSWIQMDAANTREKAALMSQSRYLASVAREELENENNNTALLLALNANPGPYGGERPPMPVSEDILAITSNRMPRLILPHEEPVRYAEFSPDGKKLVTSSRDNTAVLWSVATGERLHVMEHNGEVNHAAFSPDGQTVLTASEDKTAAIWSVDTGERLHVMEHDSVVNHATFSLDGHNVLTASYDKTASLWSVATGKRKKVMEHAGFVWYAAFSPDGQKLVTASEDKTAILWSVATGERLHVMGHDEWVGHAAFSPDGKKLVTTSRDNTAVLWLVATGERLHVMEHNGDVNRAAFSPNGQTVLTVSQDSTAVLWSVDTGERMHVMEHNGEVNRAAFSSDGQTLVTASRDNIAALWSVVNGERLQVMEHTGFVWVAAFSPDGKKVVTASKDNTAALWSVERLQVMEHDGDVYNAIISPDGQTVLTISEDSTAALWSVASGERLNVMEHNGAVNRAAFSLDGQTILTVSEDKTAAIWSVATGERLQVIEHDSVVRHATLYGQTVLTASEDKTAALWSVATGERLHVMKHDSVVNHATFSMDGHTVLTASDDKTAALWSVATGERLQVMEHNGFVNLAVFSRDEQTVLTVSEGSTVTLWSVSTGNRQYAIQRFYGVDQVVFSLNDQILLIVSGSKAALYLVDTGEPLREVKHADQILHAAFSPDGKKLVTVSEDNTAALWSVATGERLHVMEHERWVRHAAFSSDGKKLVTASLDKKAVLWSATTGERLQEFQHAEGVISAAFSPDQETIVTSSFDDTAALWRVLKFLPVEQAIDRLPVNRNCLTPEERKKYFLAPLNHKQWKERGCPQFANTFIP